MFVPECAMPGRRIRKCPEFVDSNVKGIHEMKAFVFGGTGFGGELRAEIVENPSRCRDYNKEAHIIFKWLQRAIPSETFWQVAKLYKEYGA